MKSLYLFSISILLCTISNGQDTIIKLNGDKICSKIIEQSTTEVKYKKFDFQDGPTYVESKSNIQFIKYANGSEEKIESQASGNSLKSTETHHDNSTTKIHSPSKIEADGRGYWYHGNWMNEREMQGVLLNNNDPQITLLVRSARKNRRLQLMGYTIIPLVLMGNIFMTNLEDPETQSVLFDGGGAAICFSSAIAFSISTIYFRGRHKASNKEAIKLYNAKY